jgi:transcriptional regulator with PAS, ATPase and Fis domain
VRYSWPGNVRELRNVLERARILAGDAETLEPAHLPAELRGGTLSFEPRDDDLPSLEELELRHISRVLLHCRGNRTRAAQRLGISRATLHNKINRYGLKTVGLEAG